MQKTKDKTQFTKHDISENTTNKKTQRFTKHISENTTFTKHNNKTENTTFQKHNILKNITFNKMTKKKKHKDSFRLLKM